MRYAFHTLDVFTDRALSGNPVAVLPDARGLSPERMQRVAAELNLSETVFVLPPETPEGTRRLRIFTPRTELPFAGHPTIGTAHLLASLGAVDVADGTTRIVLEEGVGPVPVLLTRSDGDLFAQLTAAPPELGPSPAGAAQLAAVLSLGPDDLLGGPFAPRRASAGVPFAIVTVRDTGVLGRIRLDAGRWESLLAASAAPHVYAIAPDGERRFRARMFAPAMGVGEDPATGAAATALGGYLVAADPEGPPTRRWTVEQGVEMGRPSVLHVEADVDGGAVTAVRVGGAAVRVADGTLEIPVRELVDRAGDHDC